jgi:hypothetical protein
MPSEVYKYTPRMHIFTLTMHARMHTHTHTTIDTGLEPRMGQREGGKEARARCFGAIQGFLDRNCCKVCVCVCVLPQKCHGHRAHECTRIHMDTRVCTHAHQGLAHATTCVHLYMCTFQWTWIDEINSHVLTSARMHAYYFEKPRMVR